MASNYGERPVNPTSKSSTDSTTWSSAQPPELTWCREEITKSSDRYIKRLHRHPNITTISLLDNTEQRRRKFVFLITIAIIISFVFALIIYVNM